MPFDVEPQPPMLNPLSFTKDEAAAMVGREIVGLADALDYKTVDGARGLIISSERTSGNFGAFEYRVAVQWRDREGNVSKPELLTKEEIRCYTRPLSLRERIASAKAAARQERQVWGQSPDRGLKR